MKLLEYFNMPLVTKQKESQSSIVTDADIESEKLIDPLVADYHKHTEGFNIRKVDSFFIGFPTALKKT